MPRNRDSSSECCKCSRRPNGTDDRRDLRPYGPGGKPICYDCAFASPEATEETNRQFARLFDAASSRGGGIVILTDNGPIPGDEVS